MPDRKKWTTVSISPEDHAILKRLADANGRKVSGQLRVMIRAEATD